MSSNVFERKHRGYIFFCPGCDELHYVETEQHKSGYYFNNDLVRPTVNPAIRFSDGINVCDSYVLNGVIRFLETCTHRFVKQRIKLRPIPYMYKKYL